ncbi:hypothetical protein [Lelliottia wanjuensis]|uniref:hypothetical protein n=1 Tax=Lelliottia wanjuensis TaxID=3050585 RepID=UPI00254ABA1E|nr:hypothetical protein [Lelliottia sp. V86_10]MDK9583191.1 hypothetical protein [Lelliottia sp. V86_10]
MNKFVVTQEMTNNVVKLTSDLSKSYREHGDFLIGVARDAISKINNPDGVNDIKFLDNLINVDCDGIDRDFLTELVILSILEVLGCHNASRAFAAKTERRIALENDAPRILEEIVALSTSEYMRKIASSPRNENYETIIKIIKLTWEKYPRMSKKELIRQLLEYYNKKVDESTLKRWIKKENLTPPRPEKYGSGSLVFPEGV